MPKRSGCGRHRRRRRYVPLPSVAGSIAVAAATTGALSGGAAAEGGSGSASLAAPQRPAETTSVVASNQNQGAFANVATAQRSLTNSSIASANDAHSAMVTTARREAALRAARAERVAELEANRWAAPVSDYRITGTFGAGGAMWSSRHTGIDLAAPSGTPVVAAAAGEVVEAGWDGPYGQQVVIRHSDGTETSYGHLSRILTTGGSVQAGDQIGRVGSTGNSTGPHLHLEVRPGGGDPVNPRPFLAEQGLEL